MKKVINTLAMLVAMVGVVQAAPNMAKVDSTLGAITIEKAVVTVGSVSIDADYYCNGQRYRTIVLDMNGTPEWEFVYIYNRYKQINQKSVYQWKDGQFVPISTISYCYDNLGNIDSTERYLYSDNTRWKQAEFPRR